MKLASPREAGRGRRAKRGGRGVRPRERARLPLSLALSPLPRGEGIGHCSDITTPRFYGPVTPVRALARRGIGREFVQVGLPVSQARVLALQNVVHVP
jgi:hypothetical protein